MRKIVSKDAKKKNKRRNQTIVGVVLIFVMLFGTLGYAFQGQDEDSENKKIEYNGYEFIKQNNFWITTKDNKYLIFSNNPEEIEKFNVQLNSLDNYKDKPLYINSENPNAELEIYRNLEQFILRRQYACLDEECEDDWPIKTCEDNFIIIEGGEVSEIVQQENCVFIKGPEEDLVKITDAFLLKVLEIEPQ